MIQIAQHAPLPWHLQGFANNDYIIGTTQGTAYQMIVWGITKANARLIVRSVNSHQALLEACKAVKEAIELLGIDSWSDAPYLLGKVDDAITLAEKEG